MKRTLAILALFSASAFAQTVPPQLISPAGSTAGQAIVSNGPAVPPTWGAVSSGSLAPIAANRVLGNFTGASTAPSAFVVPSCSTANSALQFTTNTGLSCGTTFALTGGTLGQFASTTSAQLATVLTNETGTGSVVFSDTPTFTGTVNVAALTATGAITPSQTAGIVGTTTNNSANAGAWGEYGSNQNTSLALTNSVLATATSLTLGGGDYTVGGSCTFSPAGSTVVNTLSAGVATGASLPAAPDYVQINNQGTGTTVAVPVPTQRFSLATTTTLNLNVVAGFSVSTLTVVCKIWYRRAR